jgi:type I restriction enzyme S subunit
VVIIKRRRVVNRNGLSKQGPYLITGQDIHDDILDWDKCYHITLERYNESPEIMLKDQDLLFTKDGTIGKTLLIEHLPGLASLNSHLLVLRPLNNKYLSKYLQYTLKSQYFDVYVQVMKTGTTFDGVSQTTIEKFKLLLPSLSEQQQIIKFLDQKTFTIDTLIKKKLRKIELLKEQRASFINQAVTKGLNLYARMKDSGVEWIVEIPLGWNISKLKYLTSNIGDGIHATPNYVENSDKYFINGNNLIDGSIEIFESTKCVAEEEFLKYKLELSDQTVLLSINGTIGNLSFYDGEQVILGKSVCYINCLSMIDTHFLFYLLKSSPINDYFTFELTGTTINNLSLNTVRNTPIPLPQMPEQHQIVEYLDNKTSEIDKQVDLENRKIELLKEYRQSLISEVVTGKIDVRSN